MKSIATVAALIAAVAGGPAFAQADMVQINLASECTTDGVSASGRGHGCAAENPSCQTAPAGYVINKDKLVRNATSWNGPLAGDIDRSCPITFSNPEEIIPGTGITLPKTVCLQAVAESGSGMRRIGVRGWSKCVLNGPMVKYK
ncbi:hypothetical protein STAQ_01920 [Allostella sp. ATCC 35155]|nr:hypothetical protein STAQ_01920 [Stella sp. ATCC 35155]